jgi:hypothetical protein
LKVPGKLPPYQDPGSSTTLSRLPSRSAVFSLVTPAGSPTRVSSAMYLLVLVAPAGWMTEVGRPIPSSRGEEPY